MVKLGNSIEIAYRTKGHITNIYIYFQNPIGSNEKIYMLNNVFINPQLTFCYKYTFIYKGKTPLINI